MPIYGNKPKKCNCKRCEGRYIYKPMEDIYINYKCTDVFMAYYGRYDEAIEAFEYLPWGDNAPDLENILSYEEIANFLYRLKKKTGKIKQLRKMNETLQEHIKDLIDDRALLFELMDKYNVTDEDKNKIFDNLKG